MYLFHTSVKSDTPGQPSVDVDGRAMEWEKKERCGLLCTHFLTPGPHRGSTTQREERQAAGVGVSCTKEGPGLHEVRDNRGAHAPLGWSFQTWTRMDM